MRLAKLTVAGFKSFADRTEIPFDRPIVGIVGPNGCGKSNVVDAIKWVLGDQSPKSLRGGAMMDVIFNGSANRRPSGMASVTLTFDNPLREGPGIGDQGSGERCSSGSDDQVVAEGEPSPPEPRFLNPEPSAAASRPQRALPLDAEEVAITRQLYRDGTSEYRINGQRARLRDIRELFMDTGIGTDAYSIIEQGKVARMLDANADERRQIFEEAAGISRFKARKKEALRKLDRTEQNLTLVRQRLEDTERRLRSVKMQAARARSYQEHRARLGELQLAYALAEYHRLSERLAGVAEQLEQAEADRAAAQRELAKHDAALADADTERGALAKRAHGLDRARVEQQSAKKQAEQQRGYARATLADVKQQIERDTARLDELTRRGETLDAEAADHAGRIDGLTAAKSTAAERLDAARDEHRALQQALHEKRARLEDEKNGLTDLLRATSRLHNQITSIDAFEKSLASTRDKLDRRSGDVASQVEALLTARDETAARLAEARQLIDAETAQLAEKRDLAGRFGEQQRALSERLSESREHRAELDARRHLLQEMQDNHEGVADPVKALLARDDVEARGDVALPIRGLVAELFDCDVRHAPLVEAALGDHQQSLVVDRLADLCDAAGSAGWRDALAGRVTFLPLNAPAPRASDTHESAACVVSAKSHRTVLDLVRYPAWLAPLAERLLGRTLIVRDLDAALLLRTTLPTGFRFITEGGEVLDEGGRVTAGPVGAATAGGGLIARRSELASLRARLAELDAIIRSDHDTLTAISDQAAHLERVTAELQQSLFDANAVRVELTGRLENVNVNLAALEKERPVLAAEVEQVHRQLRDADAKRTTHRGEAARLESSRCVNSATPTRSGRRTAAKRRGWSVRRPSEKPAAPRCRTRSPPRAAPSTPPTRR